VTALLSIFKPAPHLPLIQDSQQVNSLYPYWRLRIFYAMFIGYAIYYFTRLSFTFAMPGLISDLNFDKGQLGILSSVFALTYGFSKFVSGVISDRSNARYFMAIGLFATGVINILFGLSSSLLVFVVLWGLNGWFQGFGWPPCARFLMQWYSHSERGAWWSSWNISHNVGSFIIPWIVGGILQYYGWRYAMFVPGIIAILTSFFLINRLRDTPQSLGLPPIEEYRNDYPDSKVHVLDEQELSAKQLLFNYVLNNRYIWMLAFAYFFVYLVRIGINSWTMLFLIEDKGYSIFGASGVISLFEIGGTFGSLSAGWASDRLFGAKRGPVNVIYALGILVSIIFFWISPVGCPWLDSLAVFCLGFAIFGPQMLIGVAAAELSHKQAAATSTGFIGFVAYLGAAAAGYPLGRIAQNYGWEGFFWTMIICSVVAFVLLLPLWNVTHRIYTPKDEI
jgi:OPA family sugar phosphate sensor protein UhpC-like MFS transporter